MSCLRVHAFPQTSWQDCQDPALSETDPRTETLQTLQLDEAKKRHRSSCGARGKRSRILILRDIVLDPFSVVLSSKHN